MDLFYTIIALFLASIGSVGIAGTLLFLNDENLEKVSTYLMYFAGGTLLGASFLGMIPKALEMNNSNSIFGSILIGILFFFVLEKIILWRSCRSENCERHIAPSVPIILIGDAFHNAIDGVVIASSFLTSFELGVFVTFSVVLHEIPQELGDFGLLVKGGLSKKKALGFNILSGATALVFGVVSYFTLETIKWLIPYALSISAASFIYIALADLIPEMHRKTSLNDSLKQIVLIISGIMVIYFIKII